MSVFKERAEKNVAKWGLQDYKTLGLAVAEEAGELAQAILQFFHETGDEERIEEEAIDLGALCVQVLMVFNAPDAPNRPTDPDCIADECDDNCKGWGRCEGTGPSYDEDDRKLDVVESP